MDFFSRRSHWSIILTLAIQSAGIIWWASTLQAQVNDNSDSIKEIKTSLNGTAAVTLTREQLNDILSSRDVQITSLQNNLDDFKTETRASLSRIERKLN